MILRPRPVIAALGLWMLLSSALVLAFAWQQPVFRAVVLMGWGLILIWNIGGGLLMYGFRDAVGAWV